MSGKGSADTRTPNHKARRATMDRIRRNERRRKAKEGKA